MNVLNSYGDINPRSSTEEDPSPDVLKDGTRKPAGFRLNGASGQQYAGQTERRPRPTDADFSNPRHLAEMQQDWDRSDYLRRWRVQIDQQSKDELAAKRAQKERERQEADAQHAARQRAQMLEPARLNFLASGGTPEEWETQKDSIAADILRSRAVQAGTTSAAHSLVPRHAI